MKSLEKALDKYIRQKHTTEECSGYIDGYKQAVKDFKNKSMTTSMRTFLIFCVVIGTIGIADLFSRLFDYFVR